MTNVLNRSQLNYLLSNTVQNTIVAVVLCIVFVLYFIWSFSPVLAQFGGDNATYFLTAKLFSPYTQSSPVSEYFAAHSQYPPLYPLLLALFGGGDSILIAHLVTTIFLIAAMLVMYRWGINLSFGRIHSLALVVIFAMTPGTYMQALSILSENLYLLLSLSGLCVITFKKNIKEWLWVAALMIACASMTRSAGLPLILSFIIYLFFKRDRNKYLLSLTALLPMIIWGLLKNQKSTSYATLFSEYYSTNSIALLFQQFINQIDHMLNVWCLTFTNGSFGFLILSFLAVLCVIGMFYRLFSKELDGIYVFFYLLMILIWPYPAESMRLLYPVVPVLLVQASIVIKKITNRWCPEYKLLNGNVFMGVILIIILIPNLILTIHRFNLPVDKYLTPYKRTYAWYNPNPVSALNEVKFTHGLVSSFTDAKNYVPEGQCIYSIKPSIIGLHMERISQRPPYSSVEDNKLIKIIEQSNCKYFYLLPFGSPSYNKIFYPYERLKEKLDIIKIYHSVNNKDQVLAILAKLKD